MTKWVCPKCGSPDISYDDESHTYTCVSSSGDVHEFIEPKRVEERKSSSPEAKAVDSYLDTISRLEPDISPIDASAFYASAAISLKRLADSAEKSSRYTKRLVEYERLQGEAMDRIAFALENLTTKISES